MRWKGKRIPGRDEARWKRKFAWLPVRLGVGTQKRREGDWIWFERYFQLERYEELTWSSPTERLVSNPLDPTEVAGLERNCDYGEVFKSLKEDEIALLLTEEDPALRLLAERHEAGETVIVTDYEVNRMDRPGWREG